MKKLIVQIKKFFEGIVNSRQLTINGVDFSYLTKDSNEINIIIQGNADTKNIDSLLGLEGAKVSITQTSVRGPISIIIDKGEDIKKRQRLFEKLYRTKR